MKSAADVAESLFKKEQSKPAAHRQGTDNNNARSSLSSRPTAEINRQASKQVHSSAVQSTPHTYPPVYGFLTMSFHVCVTCGANFPPEDGHNMCVQCLGRDHARPALTDPTFCAVCSRFQKWSRAKSADHAEGRSSSGSPQPLLTLLRSPLHEPSVSRSAQSVSRSPEHKTKKVKKRRHLPNADVYGHK
ncbi:UNVERIFIED_CONTAM: hypothetical protein FKN15_005646 [Acipenser sinensis]